MKVGLRAQSALQYRPFYARRLVGVSIALLSHCVPSGVGHSVSPSLFALLLLLLLLLLLTNLPLSLIHI